MDVSAIVRQGTARDNADMSASFPEFTNQNGIIHNGFTNALLVYLL